MSAAVRDTGAEAAVRFIGKMHNDTYADIDPLKADLSGKTIVISGASKGIGRAAAIAFAQAGASNIAITARSNLDDVVSAMLKAARDAGRPKDPVILSATADATSEQDVSRFAKKVGEAFGAVDLLINNAGYLSEWTPLIDTDPTDWWMNFEVNVRGIYLFTRAFLPLVLKSASLKTILNVTSFGAVVISEGASGYQTTKFAVCRLTEHVAADYADQGLVCVAIHPGGIKTELGTRMPKPMHEWLVDEVELPAHWMTWFARERREWLQARFVAVNWDVKELESKKDEIVNGNKLKFRMVA
ncbi:putative oxidoreductase [Microdochium trichocladiopsis]|uniref:Oxidoreductase n=1 Tax=Microdochium trichocladiopsis TaxID=1682393 RepID=A0A9P8XX06_9PEZI|nr:putative oxidoreductase [Microdochium trichocladiopsis]KAH7018042.1 putative oxidoreductase [Microdochium trichocladiopsis]